MRNEDEKEPNGFQYFVLGFSVCALLVQVLKIFY